MPGHLEEFDHGNLVNKTYYAGKAGLHEEELKFAKQAYEQNPSGASAHNLALRFPNGSDEKRKYLTIAVDEYDLNFSKFAYSHLIQDENPERARRLIEEAFEHYNIRYEENREDLNISELGMLLTLARRLGRHETASSIDSYFQSRERLSSDFEYTNFVLSPCRQKFKSDPFHGLIVFAQKMFMSMNLLAFAPQPFSRLEITIK